MMLYVIGGVVALALGIYIGLGYPGFPGSEDRVVSGNLPRRNLHKAQFLDWLRPTKR